MAKFKQVLKLANDIDEVFSYISNPSNNPVWDLSNFQGRRLNPKALHVGTVGKCIGSFLGETFESEFIFQEFKPPFTVTHRTRAKALDVAMSGDLEQLENGTKLTLDIDVKLRGIKKFITPLLRSKIKNRIKENIKTLQLNFRLMSLGQR